MANFKRIITSGCSFTEGYGLADKTKAWPYLIGEKVNLPVINLAESGIGNSRIFFKTMEYFEINTSHKKDTLLLIGLTTFSRQDFYNVKKQNHWSTVPQHADNLFIKWFWDSCYDENYYYKKFLTDIILYQNYYLRNSIRYVMFDSLSGNFSVDKNLDDSCKLLLNNINKDFYLWHNEKSINDFLIKRNTTVQIDGHPNEIGHEEICEILQQSLNFLF